MAFVGGLALAWFGHWETRDLGWSLWLSSLLVGYAMIGWSIFGPAVRVAVAEWRDRSQLDGTTPGPVVAVGAAYLVGGLFLLAFFLIFASFVKIDNFAVYAAVYAVYFSLWQRFSRPAKT